MATIAINNKEINVPDGITLIQACEMAGVEISRFCYHVRLAIVGNCRMCLVEVVGAPQTLVASCITSVADGIKVLTKSKIIKSFSYV